MTVWMLWLSLMMWRWLLTVGSKRDHQGSVVNKTAQTAAQQLGGTDL